MKAIMYFKAVNDIGGVESFVYYLSKKYDFEFYYKEGDPTQIQRLAKNIKVKKYNGEILECDKFFVNYNPDIIDNVIAKEYIMMIHCDYSAVKFKPITHPKFTKYIGVSQYVCDVFTRLTGIPSELCYNPVYIDKPEAKKKTDKIHIIYAGRMSEEKGGWRIDKIAELIDKSGIDYDLTIYTDRNVNFKRPNIIIKQPKLNIAKEMAEATFMLVTSRAEAYCLSGIEALTLGTPLICTDLPVFNELGINETNSIKINLDVTNFNPKDLLKKFNFTYTPPKDNWDKYLSTNKTYNPDEIVNVKVIKKYTDLELGKKLFRYDQTQEEIPMKISRASYLESKGLITW